jgi:hypothetical protein
MISISIKANKQLMLEIIKYSNKHISRQMQAHKKKYWTGLYAKKKKTELNKQCQSQH